jgi:hypothetical protein
VEQVGEGHVVHDEVALFLGHFEEERVVGDDVLVMQVFYVGEVALQEEDVLPIQPDRLYRKDLLGVSEAALLHYPVGALPNLLPNHVLLQQQRKRLLRRHRLLAFIVALALLPVAASPPRRLLHPQLQLLRGLLEDGKLGER